MKLYIVPTQQVQRFWHLAEPLLQKALEKGTKVIVKEISKSVLKVIMMAKLEQILNLE